MPTQTSRTAGRRVDARQAPARGLRPEHRPAAVVAVGALIAAAFMGSVVVAPLYALYQQKFGFSEITLTLIYAVYVVGNVVALLVFGQVSDQLGRKRVSLPTVLLAAVAAGVFLAADGTGWLYAGRLLTGLTVGVLSGTGTAWLVELYGANRRDHATLAAAVSNLVGISIGPILGGVLAEYAPYPLKLPFAAYIVILAAVGVAVWRTPEPRVAGGAALRDLRLYARIGIPRDIRGRFAVPAVTGFVIFALGGLYFSLIPGILETDLHEPNVAIGGAVVCELAVVSALVTLIGRRLPPARAMTGALVIMLPAVALVVSAQAIASMPLLLVATALAGLALGVGYRGSLQVVNRLAPDERRAEVVSSYFIACFVGNSVPVIGIGILATLTNPLTASEAFAVTLAVLAVAALAWYRRTGH